MARPSESSSTALRPGRAARPPDERQQGVGRGEALLVALERAGRSRRGGSPGARGGGSARPRGRGTPPGPRSRPRPRGAWPNPSPRPWHALRTSCRSASPDTRVAAAATSSPRAPAHRRVVLGEAAAGRSAPRSMEKTPTAERRRPESRCSVMACRAKRREAGRGGRASATARKHGGASSRGPPSPQRGIEPRSLERRDVLAHPVFEHRDLVGAQVAQEPAVAVADDEVHLDAPGVHAEHGRGSRLRHLREGRKRRRQEQERRAHA